MNQAEKGYFLKILRRHRKGKASDEEEDFLQTYYGLFEVNDDLITDENEHEFAHLKERIKANVDKRIIVPKVRKTGLDRKWLGWSIAAAALLVLSISFYFYDLDTEGQRAANIDVAIHPGGNKAVLTLANGKQIILNEANHGLIARQSGIRITKTADGQIVYQVSGDLSSDQNELSEVSLKNTITTPNGGQYKVVLPDGTSVLLNAASSLRYPTVFRGLERVVELEGEAYFEVAKDSHMPFRVKSGNQIVEVLGTHFNISAYKDETTLKTTLLEGAVKVVSGNEFAVIQPGEQAIVNKSAVPAIQTRKVSVYKETAWKDGLFEFDNDNIKSVMRNISRWYDVEVAYRGDVSELVFTGEIFRSAKLSEVFKILELNDINLEIKGKTVILSYDPDQKPANNR